MNRCRNRNSSTTGDAASRTPAAKGPQCSEYCWSMKLRKPSASVNFSVVLQQDARDHELVDHADEGEQRDDGKHRRSERKHDSPEDLRRRRAVDTRGLVELVGNGVEEAFQQPGVHSHRTAEVHDDEAGQRVQAEHAEHLPGVEDDQIDRDDQQQLREHLDQQEAEEAHPASLEPEAAERIGRERADAAR